MPYIYGHWFPILGTYTQTQFQPCRLRFQMFSLMFLILVNQHLPYKEQKK